MKQIMMLLIACLCCTASPTEEEQTWRNIDKSQLDKDTRLAFERWHTDSKGCLNLRKWEDGVLLVDKFKLDSNLRDSVLKVLGAPNHIHQGTYIAQNDEEIEAIQYQYFFNSWCEGDSLLPERFIVLVISKETDRVIDKAGGVH